MSRGGALSYCCTACAAIGAPVLILSGTLDQHTTIEEARAIFAAAHQPKEFWALEGAAHVSLHEYAKEEYERRVAAFLAGYLGLEAMKTQEADNR